MKKGKVWTNKYEKERNEQINLKKNEKRKKTIGVNERNRTNTKKDWWRKNERKVERKEKEKDE